MAGDAFTKSGLDGCALSAKAAANSFLSNSKLEWLILLKIDYIWLIQILSLILMRNNVDDLIMTNNWWNFNYIII